MTKQVVYIENITFYHVFRRARMLAESSHYVRNVHPFPCVSAAPPQGFSCNLILVTSMSVRR